LLATLQSRQNVRPRRNVEPVSHKPCHSLLVNEWFQGRPKRVQQHRQMSLRLVKSAIILVNVQGCDGIAGLKCPLPSKSVKIRFPFAVIALNGKPSRRRRRLEKLGQPSFQLAGPDSQLADTFGWWNAALQPVENSPGTKHKALIHKRDSSWKAVE